MTTMIEKVARAICLSELPSDAKWELCIPGAYAAIEAMREPTPEMTIVLRGSDMDHAEAWGTMIGAALSEADA